MVQSTTDPKLFSATEGNLHEFAVNVRRSPFLTATALMPAKPRQCSYQVASFMRMLMHEFQNRAMPFTQGLRTLVVATKEIPEEEWAEWDANYQAAAADLDNRDEKVRHHSSLDNEHYRAHAPKLSQSMEVNRGPPIVDSSECHAARCARSERCQPLKMSY